MTTFAAGLGILGLERPVPLDRVRLLNPGQRMDVGDRELRAFRPPLYDSPATTGFQESRSGVVFTSDCFGAALPTAGQALADDVRIVDPQDLRAAQLLWATVDSPWVHDVDRSAFGRRLGALRDMDPSAVLSTHLPPAVGAVDGFLATLELAPEADPFVGPDQVALEAMLACFAPGPDGVTAEDPVRG